MDQCPHCRAVGRARADARARLPLQGRGPAAGTGQRRILVLLLPGRSRRFRDAGRRATGGQPVRAGVPRATRRVRAHACGPRDDDRPRAPRGRRDARGGPMSARAQWLVSAAVLGGAVAVVAVYFAAARPGAEGPATEAHVHGAAASRGDGPHAVRLGDDAARRIGITYAAAEYGPLESTVRVVGTISHDETRLVKVSPKFEGWVERLYVDFTGAPVREGEPLLAVYSPMLVAAQEELLLARRLVDETAPGTRAADNARALLAAARRRLRYWDVPADEIERIERSDSARRTLVLRAPASGLVLEKNVVEGMRIAPGMDLYTLAD